MTSPSVEPSTSRSTPGRRALFRSRDDRVLAGVCGGLGRYLAVDPVVIRILAVLLVLAGVGLVGYVIAWIVIPDQPADAGSPPPADAETRHRVIVVAGAALAVLGVLLILRPVMPWMHSGMFWPVAVVAAGVVLVMSARR